MDSGATLFSMFSMFSILTLTFGIAIPNDGAAVSGTAPATNADCQNSTVRCAVYDKAIESCENGNWVYWELCDPYYTCVVTGSYTAKCVRSDFRPRPSEVDPREIS
ncbi:hypothetical protein ACN47E_000641 [Coniothyrium glycines]